MPTPSKTLLDVEKTLHSVIGTLIDSQEGFKKIGDLLKDPDLKRIFLLESLKRAEFRGDLEEVLHQEGVHDILESGTIGGAFRRAWGEFKVTLGGEDYALLETAEQGEDSAVRVYTEALSRELPLPIRQTLANQSAHVQASHDLVKAARNRLK